MGSSASFRASPRADPPDVCTIGRALTSPARNAADAASPQPRASRKQALRAFSAEERERQERALRDRKVNLLLDAAAELQRIEEQRNRWRADLEAARAAVAELAERRAAGEVVTLH